MGDSIYIPPTSVPPKWVEEMHEHFRENGFYRAEDITRVLGDPRECVEVRATTDLSQFSKCNPR